MQVNVVANEFRLSHIKNTFQVDTGRGQITNHSVGYGSVLNKSPYSEQVSILLWWLSFRGCCACKFSIISWWRHQMETSSALLAICAGNSPVPGEFPTQRPVTRSFDVFFGRRLNKRLSKQSWGWWFETLSRPLWRHRNVMCPASSTYFTCNLLWFNCLLNVVAY